MTTEILTPNQVRERLAIVPTDFEKVLQEAEKNAVNVIYYSKSTPFGIYPMAVEMEKSKEALKKLQSDVVTSHVKPESIKYIF